MNRRFCFTLDLVDDPVLIAEYEKHHEAIWPEVRQSFVDAGILSLDLYLWETRLVMVFEVDASFSFERKKQIDESNPVIQEWEKLMSAYQKPLPNAPLGEKWVLMKKIFST
jgi:L-rhamnose mutarotase